MSANLLLIFTIFKVRDVANLPLRVPNSFLFQNHSRIWKGLSYGLFRNNVYIGVREVVAAVIAQKNLTFSEGSNMEALLVEMENLVASESGHFGILRKINNMRTGLRNYLIVAWRTWTSAALDKRSVIGAVPPLGALSVETLKASSLLSRYYLSVLVKNFCTSKGTITATYERVTTSDIAFVWVILIGFATTDKFSAERYTRAKKYINAVCPADSIVGWVHGSTEALIPVVVSPAAPRAAAPPAQSSDSSSSSSSDDEDGGDSSSASKTPPHKKMRVATA